MGWVMLPRRSGAGSRSAALDYAPSASRLGDDQVSILEHLDMVTAALS
jgi:hypothetical protein